MPAYVIVQGAITDPDQFDKYRTGSPATVAAAGGKYVVRTTESVSLEGAAPPERTTVIEFADREAALAWYHGEAYTTLRALRAGAADLRFYVVDGA